MSTFINTILRSRFVQAVTKAISQSNGKGQNSTPNGFNTPGTDLDETKNIKLHRGYDHTCNFEDRGGFGMESFFHLSYTVL